MARKPLKHAAHSPPGATPMAEYNKERVAQIVADVAEVLEGRQAQPNELYIAFGTLISMLAE